MRTTSNGQGEAVTGAEFFDLLRTDDEFCAEVGRAVMAAGRLESALRRLLHRHAPDSRTTKATLGALINLAEKHNLLKGMAPALRQIKTQRNYLAHSLHALFSGLVQETMLPRTGLLDSDVAGFTDRAWQLAQEIDGLADLAERELNMLPNTPLQPTSGRES